MNTTFRKLLLATLMMTSSYAKFAPILMDDITLFVPYSTTINSQFTIKTTNVGNNKILTIIVDNPANISSYLWTEGNRVLSRTNSFNTSTLSAGTHTITAVVVASNGQRTTKTITITTGISAPVGTGNYMLTAWNDLGMHCMRLCKNTVSLCKKS